MEKLLNFMNDKLKTTPMWVDYPYLWAAEEAREHGVADDELIKLLDHPEYEDFHIENLIMELCANRIKELTDCFHGGRTEVPKHSTAVLPFCKPKETEQ
jgi:hypothetical protein